MLQSNQCPPTLVLDIVVLDIVPAQKLHLHSTAISQASQQDHMLFGMPTHKPPNSLLEAIVEAVFSVLVVWLFLFALKLSSFQ